MAFWPPVSGHAHTPNGGLRFRGGVVDHDSQDFRKFQPRSLVVETSKAFCNAPKSPTRLICPGHFPSSRSSTNEITHIFHSPTNRNTYPRTPSTSKIQRDTRYRVIRQGKKLQKHTNFSKHMKFPNSKTPKIFNNGKVPTVPTSNRLSVAVSETSDFCYSLLVLQRFRMFAFVSQMCDSRYFLKILQIPELEGVLIFRDWKAGRWHFLRDSSTKRTTAQLHMGAVLNCRKSKDFQSKQLQNNPTSSLNQPLWLLSHEGFKR